MIARRDAAPGGTMLYLANYEVSLADVEKVAAKRLEWDHVQPEGFRIVCEYVAHGCPPPMRGILVFETDRVEDLNFLTFYYGPLVRFDVRPCSDALAAIEGTRRALGEAGIASEPVDAALMKRRRTSPPARKRR